MQPRASRAASSVVSESVNILGAAGNGGANGKLQQYRIHDNDAPHVSNTYSYDNTVGSQPREMSFLRKSITTNSVFRKVTSSTSFGGGGANMLSLSSTVNSTATTASSNGNSTTSIITNNNTGGGSSGSGSGSGNVDGCTEIETLMNSVVVSDISEISKNYASGAFNLIKTQLNQSLYTNYSLGLFNAKRPLNATYEKVRKFINTNLEGLLQSVNLYNTNTSVIEERNAYKIIADKFNDPNELLAQLNMLRGSVSLFPDQHITVIPVEIKAEYLTYIKTYGYPENGIWDPDLLGSIIASIGPTNI